MFFKCRCCGRPDLHGEALEDCAVLDGLDVVDGEADEEVHDDDGHDDEEDEEEEEREGRVRHHVVRPRVEEERVEVVLADHHHHRLDQREPHVAEVVLQVKVQVLNKDEVHS